MNTARIVVLAIALGAGGIAAYLVSGLGNNAPTPVQPVVQQLPTVDVLVAKSEINLGQTIKADDMQWQTWPTASASNTFIRRTDRPDAPSKLAGSIARGPFMAGEPIREQKLVKSDSGFMAAILPTGMRAVATEIAPETGAGGFILPNDRVDVVLTRHLKSADRTGAMQDVVHSEIVLWNVRVLAIDQAPKEKDGQTTAVGKTVTLELKPEQTIALAAARQAGSLSLALRSIADANTVETVDAGKKFTQSVSVVRFGIPSAATTVPTQP
jgi:pilus assembly protein CpaB